METQEHFFCGQSVRTIKKGQDILFCLTDVSDILGLTNAYRQIKSAGKGVHTMQTLTGGGRQSIIFIEEPVLYRLIFKSKKEIAIKFQDWIFESVIPQIRKTGQYSARGQITKESKEARKTLTKKWQECGIENGKEYGLLTIEEYKALRFEYGKRKKDFTDEELLLLQALESMEALNLHYNPVQGFFECKDSLQETAINIKGLTVKKYLSIEGPK